MLIFNLNDRQYHVWNELQVFDYKVPNACDNSKATVMTRFLNTILEVKCFFFFVIGIVSWWCDNGAKQCQMCPKTKRDQNNPLTTTWNNKPFEKFAQMTWKSSSTTRFINFRRISEGPFMALICTIKEENYMQFETPSHLMKPIEIPSHHMKETTFRMDCTLWEHRLQITHPPLFNAAFKLDKVDIHSWFRGVFLIFAVFATILPMFNWCYSAAFFLLRYYLFVFKIGFKILCSSAFGAFCLNLDLLLQGRKLVLNSK